MSKKKDRQFPYLSTKGEVSLKIGRPPGNHLPGQEDRRLALLYPDTVDLMHSYHLLSLPLEIKAAMV